VSVEKKKRGKGGESFNSRKYPTVRKGREGESAAAIWRKKSSGPQGFGQDQQRKGSIRERGEASKFKSPLELKKN